MTEPHDTQPFPPEATGPLDFQVDMADLPVHIDRYRVVRILGEGGFGVVFLAVDEDLQRPVAVKVPHPHRIKVPGNVEAYRKEARAVARLDHPAIVPVYDVGENEQFPFFVVSKYIEGTDLSRRLREAHFSPRAAAELVAVVADGLHYAHKAGLVHRDIKPGNILLDSEGRPYIADFGVALHEEDVGRGPRYAGTPAYMSPEQARGEGHRVDGRSDVFSLGVVLYRLLTGCLPFEAPTDEEMLEQVVIAEPRPPRQIDDRIPKELERICLKALAKRAAERYTTAKDLADDLRLLSEHLSDEATVAAHPSIALAAVAVTATVAPRSTPPPSRVTDAAPPKIVPKGLRSFDAHDADFFLELLAGPRDREGLPDSVRFWKDRIEETDSDETFPVGLAYGPSGCGKSSLFKAGVLPRLSDNVIAVYVEATADKTESRLLNQLHKRCPELPGKASLVEALTGVRRGRGLPPDKKLLIVIDQFEQWLHAGKTGPDVELVRALRHCDGGRVQCVVMVRDDFWLAVSRFMRDLEVDLVEGRNIALVDLFDLDHARKVLGAFGRAFGKLPERHADVTREQKEFLRQAVTGLAQDGRVICVRLALFAEMMKGRPWTPAALKEVGGAEGTGVAFLEDTFSAPTANPQHRLHQRAARAVLKALLPESGSDIKGNMRSEAELLAASGYAGRRHDFDDLMRILDAETRLLTPTDPEGSAAGSGQPAAGSEDGFSAFTAGGPLPAARYYQLSHDYLVPSLREWLTRKQKETRQGRAELKLVERTAAWLARPERRSLPSAEEWLRIRLFTRGRAWTPAQRRMMHTADAHYAVRGIMLLVGILIAGWGIGQYTVWLRSHSLRRELLRADVAEVPALIHEIEPRRDRVDPLLHEALKTESDPRKILVLRLGLVGNDATQVPFLREELLEARLDDFVVIRDILKQYRADLIEPLAAELADGSRSSERRLRAGCALAAYVDEGPHREESVELVVSGLVNETPTALTHWRGALEPMRRELLPELAAALENRKWGDPERRAVIDFYREFTEHYPDALKPLQERLAEERPGESELNRARRQAALAAALAALDKRYNLSPLMKHTEYPTLRSFLIERLAPSGAEPEDLKRRLDEERDVSARRALILALGSHPGARLPELVPYLEALYEFDGDAGIHAAAGWVLRHWERAQKLPAIDARLVRPRASDQIQKGRDWFINSERQTFTIIEMPKRLPYRLEVLTKPPPHRFAIGATEVTVRQFLAFRPDHRYDDKYAPHLDAPVNFVSWYDAAQYCNWLSANEGLQPCYQLKGKKAEFFPDYLRRSGYRLPTADEWQYACRAGAKAGRSFGEIDDELTSRYAWWADNTRVEGARMCFPVGIVKPNDFGLFDMHGNVTEWCQETTSYPPKPFGGTSQYALDLICETRGADIGTDASQITSNDRFKIPRGLATGKLGIRIVRAMP